MYLQRYIVIRFVLGGSRDGKKIESEQDKRVSAKNDTHLQPHMRSKNMCKILNMLHMHRHTHTILGVNVVKPIVDNPNLSTNGYT